MVLLERIKHKFNQEFIREKTEQLIQHISLNIYAGGRITTTELVEKVFMFCELYSGLVFYPYQEQYAKRIIRSVLENDGAEITALFARQSGKTETIATVVGGMMILLPRLANMPMFADDPRLQMFKDGLWVGIFAPSQRQAQITYNRIRTHLQKKSAQVIFNDPDFRLQFTTFNGQTVALSNGSFATAISASDGSNIEGESFKFIICEEAQDISDFKIRKSIHPMGAAYNATIAKIGTATTFKGDFYEAIQRNKKAYEEGKIPVKNHFEYDYKVVIKYNPKYAKYIEKEKVRLGENSDEFQMSYCLKWILQRGMFVDIEKFEKNNVLDYFGRVMYDRDKIHVAGIDIAGKDDATVVTIVEVDWENPVICETKVNDDGEEETFIAYNTWIKDWLELMGDDYEEQYYQIVDFLKNFKIRRCVCDATKEASISHRLRANMPFEVVPFVFTLKSKSDLYKHLDGEIKSCRAKVPGDEKTKATREYKRFIEQLGELQKSYNGQYMVVSHPPERGAHDDYPDSWALAVWGAKDAGDTLGIEVTNKNRLFEKQNKKVFYTRRNMLTARRR